MARIFYDNRKNDNLRYGIEAGLNTFQAVSSVVQQEKSRQIQQALAEERMSQDRTQHEESQAQQKASSSAASAYNTARLEQDERQSVRTNDRITNEAQAKQDAATQQRQGVVDAVKGAQGGTLSPEAEAQITGRVPESMLNKRVGTAQDMSLFYREQDAIMSKAKTRVDQAKTALEMVTVTDKFEGTKGPAKGQERVYQDALRRYNDASEYLAAVTEMPSRPTQTEVTQVQPQATGGPPAAAPLGMPAEQIQQQLRSTPAAVAGSKGKLSIQQATGLLQQVGGNKQLAEQVATHLGYDIADNQPETRLNVTPPGTKPTAQPAASDPIGRMAESGMPLN